MVTYTDTVSDATEELSESVREANRVIADSVVAAQERNWKFAQSIMEHEVELLKSHAESTSTVMEQLVGESDKGPALFKSVAESAVAAQEKNVKFVQRFLEDGTEVLKSHVEGTRTLMQTLTEQSHKQREAFEVLFRVTWDAYRGFFPSPLRYYEKAMESAESLARHGMGTDGKTPHHERQAVHSAKK
ncbi:MAG TPA: hypothetical protein VIY29_21780 [Ktedonobacteraceae bacterium]